MLVFGMVAADLSLSLFRSAMELAFSPLDTLLAFTSGRTARAWGGGQGAWGRAGSMGPGQESRLKLPWPARDSFYAAQLRRAAPVARLFASAPPGGEKEAAYHALVRLAAAADAALGASAAPLTPGMLYRDLAPQQAAQRWRMPGGSGAGTLAFDARVCAELDRRDASRRPP